MVCEDISSQRAVRPREENHASMRTMAIDLGDARTGVALSDPTGFLAGQARTIYQYNRALLADEIISIARAEKVGEIVLGNPRNMNASEGERSEKSAAFRLLLLERAPEIPVVLWDERRTTVDAHRILSENGRRGKRRRDTVDAVAATLILQTYLDYKRNTL